MTQQFVNRGNPPVESSDVRPLNSMSGVSTYKPSSEIDSIGDGLDEDFKAPEALLKAQKLANTLDTAVKLPIIGVRVGLDFLIGLIPVIGDTLMLAASLRIVHLGHQLGLPKVLRVKMVRNAAIDFVLGWLPVLGDILDIFFKANLRNVRIMEQWWVSENKGKIDALARKQFAQWENAQKD